jgi:hypothetical protein
MRRVTDYGSSGRRWQLGAFNADHRSRARASDVAYANAMTALKQAWSACGAGSLRDRDELAVAIDGT